MVSASKISTGEYWKGTGLLFVISFAICFVTDLVLEHLTHIFGTHTTRGSLLYSLFMGAWLAFAFPPIMGAIRRTRSKQGNSRE